MTYLEEYKYWLDSDIVDENTKSELREIASDDNEIQGRFGSHLEFGTGGLRSIMKAGSGMMNIYTIRLATQALSNVVLSQGGKSVVIAHDSRNNSDLFAREAAMVLAANGIKALLFESIRSTPELSFSVRETKSAAGINITASHNAKEYNGYKAYGEDGGQLTSELANAVAEEMQACDIFQDVKTMDFEKALSDGMIEMLGQEIDEKYLSNVLAQSIGRDYVKASQDIKIVYTPFHGAGYKFVPEILSRIGIKNIIPVEEQMIPDGNFPTVKSPNPENKEGFAMAIDYAKRYKADLIIGTDPDSDRCGVATRVDDDYVILSGNQVACLMLEYLITVKREQGTMPENPAVCKSIVSTKMADKICKENGIALIDVLTGFKYIGEKIKEFEENGSHNFIFGFEESIGFLAGTYARDKDAIFAAMFIAETACYYHSKGMSLYDGLMSLYEKYGYFSEENQSFWFDGYGASEKMAGVLEKLRINPPSELGEKIIEIKDYLAGVDGFVKSNVLAFELSDGCSAIIRPSGTEPRIKVYVLAQGASRSEAKARSKSIIDAMSKILSI